jgi:hypothetical protein
MVLLGIQIGGRSLWYGAYKLVPGGIGVRSVSRYVLTLSLPLGVGLAYALDRFLARPHSTIASALVTALLLAVAGEQLARIMLYSADTAQRFGTSITDAVDRRCAAFYLKPTSRHLLARPYLDIDSLTEQTFDANAYLAANRDVAENWKGSAWEHFISHGQYENHILNPAEMPFSGHYQLAASLAALAAGVPTVNGTSGKSPPGWDLVNVFRPTIGARVNDWLLRNHYDGTVCFLERDLHGGEIPGQMPTGFFGFR